MSWKIARIAGLAALTLAVAGTVRGEERHYVGTINGDIEVVATLRTDEKSEVTGEYRYTKYGNPLWLKGKRVKNEITLAESNRNNTATGTFSLTESASGHSGYWKSADGKKAFAAEFKKIGESLALTADKENAYSVRTTHVKLEGKSDFFAALNAKLEREAETRHAASVKDLQSWRADATAAGASESPYWFIENDLVLYADESLVSIRKQVHSYTGGAHGMTHFVINNYAWRDGKVVTLSAKDLLPLTDAGAKLLREKVIKKLKVEKASWPEDLKLDVAENLPEINFTAGGIMLSFTNYEVGPFADGTFTVGLPWSELKGILGDKSAIHGLVK